LTPANTSPRLRLCIFGAQSADSGWLASARADAADATCLQLDDDDAAAALHNAAQTYPGDDLILLRANTTLPPYWLARLTAALAMDDVLVASPLDNVGIARAPLATGFSSDADASTIDALCHAHGHGLVIDAPSFSPLLSAWSGVRLQRIGAGKIHNSTLPQTLAPLRGVVLDHLYVADPTRRLRGPAPVPPGGDALPPSALGELREKVSSALAAGKRSESPPYFGLDGKPVVLHVLHGWGGGAERFVRDLAGNDNERHHLVLTARGNFDRRRYGEVLELLDSTFAGPPLRRLELPAPIASTSFGDPVYKSFLDGVIADYAIGAIVVSSLIGHSLDLYRTGLPCIHFVHDFYPMWPLLHRNLDDPGASFDAAELARDLHDADAGFEFAERDPGYWLALREAVADALLAAQARLVAPSRSALDIFLRLQPRLSALSQTVIAHGLEPWWAQASKPTPQLWRNDAAAPRRLRLIVLGRVRRGKASHLLRKLLPALSEQAELFLIGAGPEAHEFFGRSGVHILLQYRRDELPGLLASIAPDAAMILPDFAETFSYTLSELGALGIPTIATRLGALGERIHDGIDGFLVAPEAGDILATLARLRAQPEALAKVRSTLARIPLRSLADMVADYRRLLPLAAPPRAAHIADASIDRIAAQVRAGELGDARRETERLHAHIEEQKNELLHRSDWGIALERDVRRARQVIAERDETIESRTRWAQEATERERQAHEEMEKRTQWALGLDAQLREAQATHANLRGELDDRTRWALSLDAQLNDMRASTSWRITKPLRFAMRKLRGARARLAFQLARARNALTRTRGSLARRGVAGTIRRIGDEFERKRGVPEPAPIAASLPAPIAADAAPEPFSVPASTQPKVGIVIPVYNKIEYTLACLRSLAEHAGTVPFEIVVVDDCSSDATPEHLARIDGIRVLRNERNLGFIGSCNAGAAATRSEYVLFLNNDTIVTKDWLEALIACFDEEPDAGLVGAKLVYPDGRLQEAGGIVFRDGSGWNYGRFDNPADPRYEFRREADYCSGAAIMLTRALFDALGGFDTRYTPAYYEDTDLAFAVRAAGKKVYFEPRSVVVHFEGITSGTDTSGGVKKYQVVNRGKFLDKWKDALAQQPAPIDSAALAPAAANFRHPRHALIVDAYTPTPDQDSGSLRMTNLMRLLREAGWRVSFLPDNFAHAAKYTRALQALGVEALYHPFFTDPASWLRENGAGLDAVILSRHYVASNYVGLVRLYAPRAQLIFDTVDLHYLREQRSAELNGSAELARQASATRASELKLMRECDVTLVVSAVEKELLAREVPQARVEVLSNVHDIYGLRRSHAERADLVFVGGFQHPPNIDAMQWFVREVFPLVLAHAPQIKLNIIGSKIVDAVRELASENVIVHGYVEDIAPFMDGCRISIAPLRVGAGVKGKVNMAMSYGLPVVATATAVEGMHVETGRDVLVADSPVDFADAVLRLYDDEALWNMLSANGLANVSSHFSFDAAREALAGILPR
jgi:GT2 family glycosyltransferase/glycosyltransferase involved in cell wall biosynthesis